jgi:cyclopropane fatty-acyl-phospholipid synthase-like methyltransferase
MKYFEDKKNVDDYIQMAKDYDGRQNIAHLSNFLSSGSSILEIGMGPGKDLEILSKDYKVTGSDISNIFLDIYREKHPNARLLLLDAISLETNLKFDCIYSNKVLHHLSDKELKQSFQRQHKLLNPKGILCHTIWYGNKKVMAKNEVFHYYTEKNLEPLLKNRFRTLSTQRYTEMVENDSLLLIVQKC